MPELVPNRFLFDIEVTIPYRSRPPAIDGNLSDWSDAEVLPSLSELDGKEDFAVVWCCWNENGLYMACKVEGKRRTPRCDPRHYWSGDNIRLCTDTRDTRNNRRATRFCQQFYFLPTGGGPKGKHPVAGLSKIRQAKEEAPEVPVERISIASNISRGMYALEVHIPPDCLSGFDPDDHPRIGLYYIVEDDDFGQQYLTVGDELNWLADPSTWATAVLAK